MQAMHSAIEPDPCPPVEFLSKVALPFLFLPAVGEGSALAKS